MNGRLRGAIVGIAFVTWSGSAIGQGTTADTTASAFRMTTAIKASALVSRAPDDPLLFPDRVGADGVWRIRVEPELSTGKRLILSAAYQQGMHYASSGGGIATVGILPSRVTAPFRIRSLDWTVNELPGGSWWHEIDRANARLRFSNAEITIGRQALGWGRGVTFGAVDLFAPFSTLEADREWRRGVDALRADVKLTDRSSVDVAAAFGPTLDSSAFAARIRGYARSLDLELMAGRRARDVFGGMTMSAAVGDAAVHGEVAMFRSPLTLISEESRVVWKAVAGGSYRFGLGSGVLAYFEYHYSGFGARRPEDILFLLSTPQFKERYLRGDMQILSRHAMALTGSYEQSPEWGYSGLILLNPADRSGVIAPSVTFTPGNRSSLIGSFYLPFGRPPDGGVLRSEYGTAAVSALLQLRIYL